MTFLILFTVAACFALFGKALKPKTISWKETGTQICLLAIIAGIASFILYDRNLQDTEIWNGKVLKKAQEKVSCSHDYKCRCHDVCSNRTSYSGSGKNRSSQTKRECHEECSTCYEHPSGDFDWIVYTSNNEKIEIAREDAQGKREPLRFSSVKIGEPTAVEHKYKNYLLAAPDSVLHSTVTEEQISRFKGLIPEHSKIFDYYRANQFFPIKISEIDSSDWNQKLSQINADLGARKQVNVIVMLTSLSPEFFSVLRAEWKGGKKNDVIVVIGINNDWSPQWMETMAWSIDGGFGTRLRQNILDLKTVQSADAVLPIISNIVDKYYQRKPMKDFQYLLSSIQPTTEQWIICFMVMIVCSGLLSWFFHRHEIFFERRKYYYRFDRKKFRL